VIFDESARHCLGLKEGRCSTALGEPSGGRTGGWRYVRVLQCFVEVVVERMAVHGEITIQIPCPMGEASSASESIQ
jgi:hypothetical protein